MSSKSAGRISIASLIGRLLALLVFMAALLFIPAGRLDWLQAWLFILAFGAFLAGYGGWSLRNDPEQLAERSRQGANTKSWDRLLLSIYSVLLIGMLVVAGLDAGRFRWAPLGPALQVTGWIGCGASAGWIGWVVSVNTYLSRWVRIQDDRGQQVIQSGPYHWVRHPMYLGIVILMLSVPLVLGSGWTLLPGGLIVILYIIRTALEDRTLQAELPGYAEYTQRVRYRLIPGVW
jgi:protein-S-isoprenylcysteine O-methyltransferase Ste14